MPDYVLEIVLVLVIVHVLERSTIRTTNSIMRDCYNDTDLRFNVRVDLEAIG